MDNTTFGNNTPTLPQWTGPPRATVQVQAILFASLAASLFSAFLAMLGKQWLNRYGSADRRGTTVERSQNRQRKLDGIVAWYFDNVMESLPLMLQAALLLFGCALSRYLWEINMTIALVVLGVTSFGVLFHFFIVIAGTAFEDCPYQTPGAHILRHHLLPTLRSTSSLFLSAISASYCYRVPIGCWNKRARPLYSRSNIDQLPLVLICLLLSPVINIYHLAVAMFRLLVSFVRMVYRSFMTTSLQMLDPAQQAIMLDLRCVSWMLQTSLDKTFLLSAFEYLAEMPELACLDPSLVVGCFNVFISCVNVDRSLVMTQGPEQLAKFSASCFLRTFHHFSVADPTSRTLADLRRRYNTVFPSGSVDFKDLPFRYTMVAIHTLVKGYHKLPAWWNNAQEHIELAGRIEEVARVGYRRTRCKKVPRWTLRFALDSMSRPSPPPVVANCLKIIAIDLGCDISNIRTLDERCVTNLTGCHLSDERLAYEQYRTW